MLKLVMKNKKRGVALIMVIGLVAIVIPLIFMLSQIGSSDIRMAKKLHENLLTESIALSGAGAGYSRLKGNIRGYQDLPNEVIKENKYALNLRPTGEGFIGQDLYYLMAKSRIGQHDYAIMAEAEQFYPDPSPPVLVITHDYWATVEPYEINIMADVLSMQNYRGLELLRLEETRDYERSIGSTEYAKEMRAKTGLLPGEISAFWPKVVDILVTEKL